MSSPPSLVTLIIAPKQILGFFRIRHPEHRRSICSVPSMSILRRYTHSYLWPPMSTSHRSTCNAGCYAKMCHANGFLELNPPVNNLLYTRSAGIISRLNRTFFCVGHLDGRSGWRKTPTNTQTQLAGHSTYSGKSFRSMSKLEGTS